MVATLLERRLTHRQTHLRDGLVDLVLAQGFSQLTMDQFAAELNCSKRTLYGYFPSKEELFVAMAHNVATSFLDPVVDALSHLGVRNIDMPATPQRVWQAISAASSASTS